MNHAGSYILAGIAFLVSIVGYFKLRSIGFPDGYMSEWDAARKALLTMLIGISWFVSVFSIWLGRSVSIKSFRRLKIATAMYVPFVLAVEIIDSYFAGQSGRGG